MRWMIIIFALATSAAAQTPGQLIQAGDAAAAVDHHVEAIAAYEAAIAKQPALRTDLAAKLGRQYLWADKPARAVALLREYLKSHPGEEDVRFDYALALSWNNELGRAQAEYEQLETLYPGRRQQARLRRAQIYRWQDRQSAAAALYRKVVAEGNEAERRDARVGLAFVELEMDYKRGASNAFAAELERGPSPTIFEGSAISAYRLGDPGAARAVIGQAEAAGAVSRDLADVRRELQLRDRPAASPRMTAFRDADGTTYRGSELAGSIGWMRSGRAEAMFGSSSLERGADRIDDRWGGLSIEHRFTPSFVIVASGRRHDFDSVGFRPTTGELDLIATPTDRTRIDIAGARILIADNLAALQHQLAGNFASAGIDQRVTFRTSLSASADATRWNSGNQRQRFRVNVVHRFESVPRFTVEWPTLYQRYDEGFRFNLFSPRRYVETGPALNVYRRFARYWNAAAYVRVGVQEEDALGWKGLGIVRLSLDRDLHDIWAMGAELSWSNSNLASATGFRRTSGSLRLTRRF